MCQALSRHQKASVSLYGKRGAFMKDPYAHYDVKNSFRLVRSWFGKTPVLSGILRLISVIIHAGIWRRSDAYYGRDAIGLLFLTVFKVPVFYEAHQIPQGKKETVIISKLLRSPYLRGVVVISKGLEHDFKIKFPFYKKPILIAHDGADIPSRAPARIPQKLWKGRKNIIQVGYTGSLHKGKGMELIYDIAQLVPEMDFHVLGGPKEVQHMWEEKGLPPNLFMYGSKPHSEIPSYLAKFDIVLAPYQNQIHIGSGADISRWISPMKLFEYMAAGKPIICSNIPVLEEIITHGRNGLIVSSEDPTAWIDALCDLSKSAAFREAIGYEGIRDIQNKFSWDIRANNVIQFIRKYK